MTRAAFITVLLGAHAAFAGWSNAGPITGTVSDLYLVDGGVTLVSTTTGASAIAPDGGVLASVTGAVVGAGLTSTGCLVALGASRNFIAQPCATPTPLVGGYTISRFRALPSGFAQFLGVNIASNSIYVAPSVVGPYAIAAVPTWLRNTNQSMGVGTVSGAEVSVFNQATAGVQVSVDGGLQVLHATNFVALDAVPFSRGGALAIIAVAGDGGLTFTDGGVSFPTGPVVQNVAFVTDDADGGQRGYGLATTANGTVYSPIPDPAHPGETWVVRARAPALSGRVHCDGARYCAGVAAGTLQVLENLGAPTFDFDGGTLTPGATVIFSVDAGDPDDDPLFVEWSSPGVTITPVPGVVDHQQVQLTVPSFTTCGSVLPVTITAWDGLPGHETTATISVPVIVPPGPLGLSPLNPTTQAGGAHVVFSASVDGGCPPGGTIAWSVTGSDAGSIANGEYLPPLNVCLQAGEDVTVTATQAAQSASAVVHVTPWGPALEPQFTHGTQVAGTTVQWAPTNASHVCQTAPGFPGTSLIEWKWDAGQVGITVTPSAQGLTLATPDCIQSTVVATARRSVNDGGASSSTDAGTLIVDVSTTLNPLSGFSMGFVGYDGGFASGTFSVTGNCLDLRALTATVDVQPLGGGDAGSTSFTMVPGPWQLPVEGGCAGGTFQATAHLLQHGVDTGLADSVPSFSTGRLDVYAGALTPTAITASCGGGASTTLSLGSMAGTCESAALTWTQLDGGPQMDVTSQSGRTLGVQSHSLGFDVVGTTVTYAIDVNGGPGNQLSVTRAFTIDGPRFVRLEQRLSPIQIDAEDALVAEVTMVNESLCDADALAVSIDLGGLLPVVDSVKVDDVVTPVTSDGVTLQLPPLALAAGQARVVRFLARARLLGTPGLVAHASLRGVSVELPATVSSPLSSCGCSASGASGGLALLALALRRRRPKGAAA